MEKNEIYKKLSEEFPPHEIKFRVGSTTKDKTKGKPLAYIDARAVMDRLDDVMGFEAWQDKYDCIGGKTICYLSLRIGGEWLTKADGAGDTNIEGEKGGISDALKRAAVKWGVGRYLYHWDFKWMPINQYKQLEGDPWEYKIKTEREQRDAAECFCENYLEKLNSVNNEIELLNLQTDNSKFLQALQKYPDLHKVVIGRHQELIGGVGNG